MSTTGSVKALVRDVCAHALCQTGATDPGLRLHHRLSIITFHRVLTASQRQDYPLPGLAVTPEELDWHLGYFTRHFRCVSLARARALWAERHVKGAPLLAVTFDDGQLDNYLNALPVLERHGVTATFFVPSQVLEDQRPLWYDQLATALRQLCTCIDPAAGQKGGAIGSEALHLLGELQTEQGTPRTPGPVDIASALEFTKAWTSSRREDWMRRARTLVPDPARASWDGFMSVDQLKTLATRGHEIGSHSHSHPILPQCPDDMLLDEVAGSKQRLESALGLTIESFCYPNGSTDGRTIDLVRRSGYQAAVTTEWGSNAVGADPLRLRRFDMNARNAQDRKGRLSQARLAWRMSGLHPGLGRG
ncbi:MAG: polysaccharide deacetylase family protein [Hydrogenophaga sp.]|nr:polysaccharide deacetylase family protein [Hydrogenophaga sp.]